MSIAFDLTTGYWMCRLDSYI